MGKFINFLQRIVGGSVTVRHHANLRSDVGYWKSNSIYLDNIFNKISTDVAMMKFKHLRIKRANGQADVWEEYVDSDLMEVLHVRPNSEQSPVVFWSKVIRSMLKNEVAVVLPVYENGKIKEIVLADNVMQIRDGKVQLIVNDLEKTVDTSNCWVFENPKENVSTQLGQITRLIDDSLRSLSVKLSKENNSLKGLLKLNTVTKDQELKRYAEDRVSNIMDAAKGSGIGYLDKDEDFQELNNEYSTASKDELEFLKSQLYQAYGINEKLFTCDYTEDQYRAYYQSVVKVFIRVIHEELMYKALSKTARTQGQQLYVYMDLYDVSSLKDLNEFAFKQKYSGNINSNEVRTKLLGLPPYQGGDTYETNKNAVQIGNGSQPNEDVAKLLIDLILKGGE